MISAITLGEIEYGLQVARIDTFKQEAFRAFMVSDHRGPNSQVIDFESVKIYPIFTIKIENPEKSNT